MTDGLKLVHSYGKELFAIMGDIVSYDSSILDLRESSGLLSDPLFHLENQRQISLRHLQMMKSLQVEKPDAQLVPEEEHELAVRMSTARVQQDLKNLGTLLGNAISESVQKRRGWRWSLSLLAFTIVAIKDLVPLSRSQKTLATAIAFVILSAQTARRESAPNIYAKLYKDVAWLNTTITTFEVTTDNRGVHILKQAWWKILAYV